VQNLCDPAALPAGVNTAAPNTILPDILVSDGNTYVTRFRSQIRFAGFGEFAGWNTSPDPRIEAQLRSNVRALFPHLTPLVDKSPVICGLRPFTTDGSLLIGGVPSYSNLFVNAGPGFNGWKVAIGSGDVLARHVVDPDAVALLPFDAHVMSSLPRIKHSPIFCSFLSKLTS